MYTAVTGFSSAYVAQEQGFFKKRGIDMEFVQTMSSGNNPPALVSNSVQVAGPTMPTLLQANDAGLDSSSSPEARSIRSTATSWSRARAAGSRSRRISRARPSACRASARCLHFMLMPQSQANGVDPDSVKFVEVGFPQAADALKSGQIDAYPAQAPFTARILQSGAGYEVANWLKNTPDGTLTVVYATTRKWADENKDTVNALRDGMREAIDFAKTQSSGDLRRDRQIHQAAAGRLWPSLRAAESRCRRDAAAGEVLGRSRQGARRSSRAIPDPKSYLYEP